MFARYLPHEDYEKFQQGMLGSYYACLWIIHFDDNLIEAEAHLRKEIAKLQLYIRLASNHSCELNLT